MGSRSDVSFLNRTAKNSVSGTISGIAGVLVGHPFDTLKVRLQTQPIDKPVYKGLIDCFVKTVKWEGFGGLYKGVGSPIVGQMFFRAALFTSFYQFTSYIAGPERLKTGKRLETHEYFIAGALTGVVAGFVEAPIDLFKTKMQIQIIKAKAEGVKPEFRNVFHAGAEIFKRHGVRGAYQGLGATVMRDTPACGVYFGFYEYFKDCFTPVGGTAADLSNWQVLVSAGTAGFLYWFLTYPTDVIKSSMQSDESDRAKRKYRNILHCARSLYVNEGGMKRMFVGFTPCIMRAIPLMPPCYLSWKSVVSYSIRIFNTFLFMALYTVHSVSFGVNIYICLTSRAFLHLINRPLK